MKKILLLIAAFMASVASPLLCKADFSTVHGNVSVYSYGYPIAGATVELAGTYYSIISNMQGDYTFALPVSNGIINCSAPGFSGFSKPQKATVNFELQKLQSTNLDALLDNGVVRVGMYSLLPGYGPDGPIN